MSSNALDSQGMVLKRGDGGGPEVFTAIPEIKTISGPGGSATEIDVTDLSSTAKEFRLGLQDEGEISMTMQYIPANAQHAGLRADRAASTLRNFELLFTDAGPTKWSFSAFVKTFQIDNGVDAVNMANVTLRLSGAITES